MANCDFFTNVAVGNLEFWIIDSKYEGSFKIEGVESHTTTPSDERTTTIKQNTDGSGAQVNVSKASGMLLTLSVAYGSAGNKRLKSMLAQHHAVGNTMDCFEIAVKNLTNGEEERHDPVTFIDTGADFISQSTDEGAVDNVEWTFFSGNASKTL